MAVTIYDVAREAGVSAMTVSMALRGDRRVRASTRQRIIQVAERLGYTPSAVARALVSGKTRTLGVYCQRVYGPLAGRFVSGFAAAAAAAGYSVSLVDDPAHSANLAEAFRRFHSAQVEGIAVVATRIDPASLLPLIRPDDRLVLINRQPEPLAADAVWIDHRRAGYLATRHLLQLGHRRIGLLAGREDDSSMVAYLSGRDDALQEAHLQPQDSPVAFSVGDWFESAPLSVRSLLDSPQRPTALVCPHDRLALLAVVTARRMGLRVPQDLAVVGHYDLPDARLPEVPLTTFDVGIDRIGRQAFTLLLERLTGRDEPRQVRIEPRLVVRCSCGAGPV